MGKKQKNTDGGATPTTVIGVPNRDIMQRMNFLLQSSVYLKRAAFESGESEDPKAQGREVSSDGAIGSAGKRKRKTAKLDDFARIYLRTMKDVAQKTTVKMDPGVKRAICQKCATVLIPGITLRVRNRRSQNHGHWVVYTCLECKTSRRLPAPPVHDEEVAVPGAEPSESSTEIAKGLDQKPMNVGGDERETEGILHQGERHQEGKRRGRKRVAKPLPLFARKDAGHVVFKGNEAVVDSEGVFCG